MHIQLSGDGGSFDVPFKVPFGPQGEQGDVGPTGPQGPGIYYNKTDAPENTSSLNIDTAGNLQKWTGSRWTTQLGLKGSKGATGPRGDQGERGNKLFYENTEPAAPHVLGDMWIHDDKLQKWNGNAWEDVATLVGAQGPQGASISAITIVEG